MQSYIFAYDADNGNYLGSRTYTDWRTARKGEEIDGQFYFGTGVGIDNSDLSTT